MERSLPPSFFRFHLTVDTLDLGYILPTAGWIRDLHPLERALTGHTRHKRACCRFFILQQALFVCIGSYTRYRWSITATWARVAWFWGDRVVAVVPEMIPSPTAQVMGSRA